MIIIFLFYKWHTLFIMLPYMAIFCKGLYPPPLNQKWKIIKTLKNINKKNETKSLINEKIPSETKWGVGSIWTNPTFWILSIAVVRILNALHRWTAIVRFWKNQLSSQGSPAAFLRRLLLLDSGEASTSAQRMRWNEMKWRHCEDEVVLPGSTMARGLKAWMKVKEEGSPSRSEVGRQMD